MKTERIIFLQGIDHGWVVDEETFQNFLAGIGIDNVSGVKVADSLSINSQFNETLLDMLKK